MSALEFDHVSYRYPEDDFDIIDDLSFSAACCGPRAGPSG